ncbi:VanW family protein [Selenihalanaerobacter shriftii]|uniref:VanW like protein n=1 Tax=Selenihalanaerobacter shriftii TaxID=142842 RepID=A0A1T4JNN6_9FIRM|nr:VanW family protein [Selenihalanaerobacter shriftii]SJZ31687.1 VanW like protein [Selenihalanaerobacter shriftii]
MLKKFRVQIINCNLIIAVILIIILFFLITNLMLEKITRKLYGVKPGVTYQGEKMEYFFRKEVYQRITEDAIEKRIWSKEATIDSKTGKINAERLGIILDVESTANEIMAAEANTEVSPNIYKVRPYMTKEVLKEVTEVIGIYRTSIGGSSSRVKNIRLATKSINNTLVLSEEIFSFNEVVGPRTKKRGYQEAPVFFNGVVMPGVGGGICQTSSTLYNAVQEADLKVVERSPHSKPVRYVPKGQDAAVVWEILDFKFYNQYSFPIIIKGSVYGRQVVIKILGKRQE